MKNLFLISFFLYVVIFSGWDLNTNNPNNTEEIDNRTPKEIVTEIEELDLQAKKALQTIKELL